MQEVPKIIEDVRLTILREARPMLLQHGYDRLTLRGVAKASGIAVSTIYNYFESKDALVYGIFDADWQPMLLKLAAFTNNVCSPIEGLRMAVASVRELIIVYGSAWIEYRNIYRSSPFLIQQHEKIISDLNSVIHPMMLRFRPEYLPVFSYFLSQTILALAAEANTQFDTFLPIFEKLCE